MVAGKVTPTINLYERYQKQFSLEKENHELLTADDLGRLIKKIFPDCTRVRARSKDQRCYVNLCEAITKDQPLAWLDVASLSPRHGCSIVKKTEAFVELITPALPVKNMLCPSQARFIACCCSSVKQLCKEDKVISINIAR